jgi:hypothetical protein
MVAGVLLNITTYASPEGFRTSLTGSYTSADPSEPCASETRYDNASGPQDRALHVTVSPESVVLRVAPMPTTRIIHVQSPEHPSRGAAHYMYAGLGRWEGRTLIVDTKGPAIPLWNVDPPVRALREVFSFSDRTLIYRAWASLRNTPSAPPIVEATLRRCV